MSLNVIGFIALLCSLSGYILWGTVRYHIHSSIAPALVCASAVIVLFLGGLLNILPHISWALFFGGVICLIRGLLIIKGDVNAGKKVLSPGLVFFYVFFIGSSVFVKDSLFFHYDHFSHWGLVVKEMERIGGLPDYSTIVSFTNYPPGTALFLFLFVYFAGYSESMALIGHVFLMSAFLSVPFLFFSWRQPIAFIAMLSIIMSIHSTAKHSIYELLVDPLLGYIAGALALVFLYYRSDVKKLVITMLPLSSLLVLTKDSGKLFFVGVLILACIYFWLSKKGSFKSKESFKIVAGIVGIPFIIDFLWKRYVEKAYTTSYEDNKFAVSLDTFLSPSKSTEFVEEFLPKMRDALFNWDLMNTRILVISFAVTVVVILLVWVTTKAFSRQLGAILSFSALFFGFYIVMLFTMYFFLMPEGEAIRLAGFNRYMNSLVIFLSILLATQALVEMTRVLKDHSLPFSGGASLIIGGLFLFIASNDFGNGMSAPSPVSTLREDIYQLYQSLEQEEPIKESDSVVVVDTSGKYSNDYIEYLIEYERSSTNNAVVSSCEEQSLSSLQDTLLSVDYLLILQIEGQESCFSEAAGVDVSDLSYYQIKFN